MNSARKISTRGRGYLFPVAVEPVTSPLETIGLYGFTRAGSCSCGGTRNELYKKDTYILYYRKARHMFKVKMRNEIIIPITSLSNLSTELKKLFPNVAVEEKV
jgi:hypothetical protein